MQEPGRFEVFVRAAELAAERMSSETCRAFASGGISTGFWHPNGFATYRVAFIDRLGLARLHVWPRRLRRAFAGHPEIHCHRFDLHSKVLAGTYVESRYSTKSCELVEDDDLDGGWRRLRRYDVCPPEQQGHDRIVETDTDCLVHLEVHCQRYKMSEWHSLQAGEFHSTDIPNDEFCATLAFLSPPLERRQDVLLGQCGFGSLASTRPRVSGDELATMRAQMNVALSIV